MTNTVDKPIIDHYGRFVTMPDDETFVYYGESYKDGWTVKGIIAKHLYEEGFNDDDLSHVEYYATREAAEMALIRDKCLRRLKEMAYGGGWLPRQPKNINRNFEYGGFELSISNGEFVSFRTFIRYKTYEDMVKASKTITPEEKAAFLYVHKEKENK